MVGAARRGDRLATAAQLGQELVQRHVRRGHHRRVPLLEVHGLRERRGVEDGVRNHDLRARVQAAGHPHAALSQLAAVDPLQHGLQLVHARRPQDQVGAKGDQLPPVLHHGSGARARVGKRVAHGFARVTWAASGGTGDMAGEGGRSNGEPRLTSGCSIVQYATSRSASSRTASPSMLATSGNSWTSDEEPDATQRTLEGERKARENRAGDGRAAHTPAEMHCRFREGNRSPCWDRAVLRQSTCRSRGANVYRPRMSQRLAS